VSLKIRNKVSDTWLTPADWYYQQKERFGFSDFDPCPVDCDTAIFDGLKAEWDDRTFANIPYSRDIKEKFLWKAYAESKKQKLCVILCPVSTSTKIFHELILLTAKIEFVRGRLPFEGIDNDGIWCNPYMGGDSLNASEWRKNNKCFERTQAKRSGQQDLMLVIWDGLEKR
jgi:hypothetical protein